LENHQATENPFGMSDLQKGAQTAMSTGKCGGVAKANVVAIRKD